MAVRARKPVQVYLDERRAQTLARLAQTLATSQSDVLRQGIDLLAGHVFPVDDEPLLGLIGLAATEASSPGDLAERHDKYLAQIHRDNDGK